MTAAAGRPAEQSRRGAGLCGRRGGVVAAVREGGRSLLAGRIQHARLGGGAGRALRGARGGGGRRVDAGGRGAGYGQHRAGAHAGRLGDAVDALQLGQRHAVLAGDAVERLAGLQGVAPLPAGGCHRCGGWRRRGRRPRQRRAAGGLLGRRLGGPCGGQHQLLARLDGGAVGQAVDLDQRGDRHAVALGDAVQRVAFLHLDGLAARGGARTVHGPAGIAVGAGGRVGGGRRGRVIAGAGQAIAGAGIGRGRAVVGRAAGVGRGV